MPETVPIQTAEDLIEQMPEGHIARDYIRLLARCGREGYPVGMLETTIEAEAVSDWEAAACLSRDVPVGQITRIRERLNAESPLIQEHGHRKGQATYRLHPSLLTG